MRPELIPLASRFPFSSRFRTLLSRFDACHCHVVTWDSFWSLYADFVLYLGRGEVNGVNIDYVVRQGCGFTIVVLSSYQYCQN